MPSFVEQYNPGWSDQWGEMVNHLIRDAASYKRRLSFPFLRSFSPFAGHCWANGFATFPQEMIKNHHQKVCSLTHRSFIGGV